MNLLTHLGLQANRKLCKRLTFQGFPVSIENCKGSVRKGVDDGGKPWKVRMRYDYGYLRGGAEGVDGDALDVFLGPDEQAKNVFVVHTMRPPKFEKFDEDKCFLGFQSAAQVKKVYLQHYNDPRFFGGIDTLSLSKFREKIEGPAQKLTAQMEKAILQAEMYEQPGVSMSHLDAVPTFHPPSLKRPRRVPADNPGEDDDRFLDKTRRKKSTKETLKHARKTAVPGSLGVGVGVGVGHPSGM